MTFGIKLCCCYYIDLLRTIFELRNTIQIYFGSVLYNQSRILTLLNLGLVFISVIYSYLLNVLGLIQQIVSADSCSGCDVILWGNSDHPQNDASALASKIK